MKINIFVLNKDKINTKTHFTTSHNIQIKQNRGFIHFIIKHGKLYQNESNSNS